MKGDERKAGEVKLAELRKKVDAIRSEVNTIQNEGRRVSTAEIIVPGQKKLYQKVTGKPFQTVSMNTKGNGADAASPSMMSGDNTTMMAYGIRAEKVTIPGYDRKEQTPEEKKAEAEKREAAYSPATGCAPLRWKARHRAVITCASSARAIVKRSRTPTMKPACLRLSP
jgi:hypothetical protein